ncbi:cell division protein FtsL [Eubacteriales bacterium OttesenSCG-928-N13]|nr:cell division protein FtsL [Eubacteriales bacterium OttesenSCG-928-N13]
MQTYNRYGQVIEDEWWPSGQSNDINHNRQNTAYNQKVDSRTQKRRADEIKASKLSRILMYATIALALMLVFMQISRLAELAGQTKQIATLVTGIRELQNERNNLEVRLSMQQNINRVRDEAVYKLGMIQPEEGQIQVVSLNGYSAPAPMQTVDRTVGTE